MLINSDYASVTMDKITDATGRQMTFHGSSFELTVLLIVSLIATIRGELIDDLDIFIADWKLLPV